MKDFSLNLGVCCDLWVELHNDDGDDLEQPEGFLFISSLLFFRGKKRLHPPCTKSTRSRAIAPSAAADRRLRAPIGRRPASFLPACLLADGTARKLFERAAAPMSCLSATFLTSKKVFIHFIFLCTRLGFSRRADVLSSQNSQQF